LARPPFALPRWILSWLRIVAVSSPDFALALYCRLVADYCLTPYLRHSDDFAVD
jgi:hypothetical protein